LRKVPPQQEPPQSPLWKKPRHRPLQKDPS